MLAGNHDHGLVAGWIDARLQSEPSGFLGLSEPVEPAAAGRLAQRLAGARGAGAAAARLPRRVAARGRLRAARPLRRPALDRADVRAPGGRRDGALGRAAARARRAAGRLRGGAGAAVRVPAPAHAALRPRRGQRRRGRVGACLGRDGGGGTRGATPCARRRWAPATSRRSPRSTRSGSARSTATCRARRCAAAACAASARCCCGSGSPRRTCSSGTRTAPARGRATTRREWTTRSRCADHQHRLVGLPAALPLRAAERVALLAGHRGRRRRRRAAAAHPPAGRSRPPGAATPGVKQVAWQVTPAPTWSSSTPAVWCGCSTSG